MKPYDELTAHGQFRRLRAAALDACRQFDISAVELKPLNHGENTTFRVTDDAGDMHVVRIHRPGYQTPATIVSELRFLEALSRETPLNVPKPRKTPSGDWLAHVSAKGVEGSRVAVVFDWIEGRFVSRNATPPQLRQVGALTAALHRFAETFREGEGFERRVWDREFTLKNAVGRLEETVNAAPFYEACEFVAKQIRGYGKASEYGLIHADLHFGNVLFTPTGIATIDFDDLGYAHFAYDYGVTLQALSRKDLLPQYREAYAGGYASVRPLPKDWAERLEVFMAARVVFMTEWFYNRDDNPELRGYRDKLMPRYQQDLERFLSTGSLYEAPR